MEINLSPDLNKLAETLKEDESKIELGKAYEFIIQTLKEYVLLKEEYYNLIAIWIMGAVNIKNFNTYPYLFINAMKGSGKTRLLKLVTKLSGGDVLNSLTEAVLFRTEGTLGIDEFEGVNRKGGENLKELLNSAYKKGIKVKRMKKVRTITGEEQKVEEFEVFRPIIMANIWGMEEVLGDRCIKIILDRSNNPTFTKKTEMFFSDPKIKENWCNMCIIHSVYHVFQNIERGWNTYISQLYPTLDTLDTQHTLPTLDTLDTLKEEEKYLDFYNKVDESKLEGRSLELALPLLFIAYTLGEKPLNELLKTFKEMEEEKREENLTENYDISLIGFISEKLDNGYFIPIRNLILEFKDFLHSEKEWITPDWLGRALKRNNLIKKRRRLHNGVEVILDIPKAQDKIKMFK